MTDEQLVTTFDEDVRKMASVALMKIRKPSLMDFDDLVSEGFIAILESYHRWWKPGGTATLRTFLMTCLRTTYCDIVKASYKAPQSFEIGEKAHLLEAPENTVDRADLLHSIQQLTDQESRYVSLILFLNTDRRALRKSVREEMGITYEQEVIIRSAVQQKLSSEVLEWD